MLNFKKQLIRDENQKKRGVYLQLQDGSVPSFEQFKAIKDQIVKDNADKRGKTPLAKEDRMQETMDQYMKLENLMNEHPNSADRIARLQ
jgi:hypothetical protein